MWLERVLVGVFVAGAQAFSPAPIRWKGDVAENFVLARSPGAFSNRDATPPNNLIITQPRGRVSRSMLPLFSAKPDGTIVEERGLCLEAAGRSGHVVRVNRCTGEPAQLWKWWPEGAIQQQGTNRCLDVSIKRDGLDGAPVELRDCGNRVGDSSSWDFDDSVLLKAQETVLPVRPMSVHDQSIRVATKLSKTMPDLREASFNLSEKHSSLHAIPWRHVVLPIIGMAVVAALSLRSWFWRWQKRKCASVGGHGNVLVTVDRGGVSLSDLLAFDDISATPSQSCNMAAQAQSTMRKPSPTVAARSVDKAASGNLAGTAVAHRDWRGGQPRMSVATKATSATWQGNVSQQDLMVKDECLLVDDQDNILGSANKFTTHRRGPHNSIDSSDEFALHRAFSVFLFDSKGRLLLQQRAGTKITFPLVWTNTCCSHPLASQNPDEIDSAEEIAAGTAIGIKRAATRKLQHELGIDPLQLPPESFNFLTRLHYCAADHTDPEPGEWGEHEIDYVLFAQADVDLEPNPEEVASVKYVDLEELQSMMDPSRGLRWSPWFRILASRFLPAWWSDLHTTVHTDKFRDGAIHRFDAN